MPLLYPFPALLGLLWGWLGSWPGSGWHRGLEAQPASHPWQALKPDPSVTFPPKGFHNHSSQVSDLGFT